MSFLAVALGSGWSRQQEETRPGKLWIPQNTEATVDQEWVGEYFTTETRVNILLCYDEGGNILTPAGIQDCWMAWDAVMNVRVQSDEITEEFSGWYSFDGRTIEGNSSIALCDTQGGSECATMTIFDIWDKNETLILSLDQNQIDEDIADALDNGVSGPNGAVYPVLSMVSDYPTADSISAQAMTSTFFTPLSDQYYVDEDAKVEVDPILEPYQVEIWDVTLKGDFENRVILFNDVAWAEEFSKAIFSDIFKLVIAYGLLFIYLFMALGRRDDVFSARSLAGSIILTILLSAAAGLGFCWHVGVLSNPLVNTLYFLLLGLGVDDGFIIHGEFMHQSRLNPSMPLALRISKTCQRAGVSVLVTSFTDVCAFAVGASSSLPALRGFCILAAVSVFFVWLYNVTFFLAILTLDARRSEENNWDCTGCSKKDDVLRQGYDCVCCCSAKEKHDRFADTDSQKGCVAIPFTGLRVFNCQPDIAANIFTNTVGPLVVKLRFAVLAFVTVIFVIGVYGITEINQEFKVQWFLPTSSSIYEFIDIQDELFGEGSRPYSLYLDDVDYYDMEDTILALLREMESQEYTSGNVTSVTRGFKEYYTEMFNAPTNSTEYYTGLMEFVNSTAGSSYQDLVVWADVNDPAAGLSASKMNHMIKNEYIEKASQQVDTLENLRKVAYSIIEYPTLRVYDNEFIFWEQFAVIALEFWRNVISALLTVTVIIIFMIPHPVVAIVVILSVVLSILDLIGFLHHWGGSINSVSAIYLVVSIGLTVDYAAHIGHGYMYEPGTRQDKAIGTLGRVGTSVFNGGFSTILAVIIMSSSTTYIFITFFKCYFLCCVFGLIHGMLFLPALLSIMGPEVQFRSEDDLDTFKEYESKKVVTEMTTKTFEGI